ncbi:MAG TPA: hypothetical protein VGR07_21055 [Thermoanaerobaculia bacterium]|jgi:hypothetical protein|nr:hypothetical protein [Thermoanaerobaculia bacterium]
MPGRAAAVLTNGMEIVERGDRPSTVFLLSPATLQGLRAEQLAAPGARFDTARRFRSAEGVPIADAFAFMSALYFRGKIAYARRFAAPPPGLAASEGGIFVITPGFGLVPPEWALTPERFQKIRRTPVDLASRAYLRPLAAAARSLAARLPADARAVLLGSVATGKYVDVLWPVLGERLRFPLCFAGVGDMARGALLLRAARSGEELLYGTLDQPRHRRGKSPGQESGE